MKVDEGFASLERPLQKIMTWLKGEDGVKRSDVATPSREIERVRVSILHETALRLGFGELLLVEWEVGSEPLGVHQKHGEQTATKRVRRVGVKRVPGLCFGSVQ